jgi:N-acetylgalactosamine kinase
VAKLIEFKPLRAFDVRLPPSSSFVLANSLKEHSIANSHYNFRVFECRLAVNVLAKLLRKEGVLSCGEEAAPGQWKTMRDLARYVGKDTEDGLLEMSRIAAAHLQQEPYTLSHVAEILQSDSDSIRQTFGSHLPPHEIHHPLHLRDRAEHVFSEASRVLRFKRTCDDFWSGSMSEDECMKQLGGLMKESHVSCRDQYDCSCDELDQLVRECERLGAEGARLTGAGWGGWAVILLRDRDAAPFLDRLSEYFVSHGVRREDVVGKNAVATKPSDGARLYDVRAADWLPLP